MDFDFQQSGQPARPAIAEFYTEAVQNNFRTAQEGRPIFDQKEFVRIVIPGDNRTTVVEEVTDEHKARWSRQYEAFQKGQEVPLDGTPIEQWPPVSKARALELKALNIRTVEHLAAVSDAALGNLGHGARELRKQAQVWLDAAKNGAGPIARLVADGQAKDDEIALQKRQLAEQAATIDALRAQIKESANVGG